MLEPSPHPPTRSYRKPILIALALFVVAVIIPVCIWAGVTKTRRNNDKSREAASIPVQVNQHFSLSLHNVTTLLKGETLETFEDECESFYQSELAVSDVDCVVVSQRIVAAHRRRRALQQNASSILVIVMQVTGDDPDLSLDSIFAVMEKSSDLLVQELALADPFFTSVTASSSSLVTEISITDAPSTTNGPPTQVAPGLTNSTQPAAVSVTAAEEPTRSPARFPLNSTESPAQSTLGPTTQPTASPLPTNSTPPAPVSFAASAEPTMPPTSAHSTESQEQSTLNLTDHPTATPELTTSTKPSRVSFAASEEATMSPSRLRVNSSDSPVQPKLKPTSQPTATPTLTTSTQPEPVSPAATEEPTGPPTRPKLNATESPMQSALTPTVHPTATPSAPQTVGSMCEMEEEMFEKDKQEIDAACGRSAFAQDSGAQCKEACSPRFSDCCDPFGVYPHNDTCSFDKAAAGCVAYSKCQALSGKVDPAPANLPDVCSLYRIARDEESCMALCSKTDCCYSMGADNCLTENFDVCLDYAPCQNLRVLTVDPSSFLPTAPRVLDFTCFWRQPTCTKICETAKCCTDPGAAGCFQFNFISCLTYSPCNDVTTTNIEIAPQFSHVGKLPDEIDGACNDGAIELTAAENTCEQYCRDAACCWDPNPTSNCFNRDPLGCLAWNGRCQVLLGRRLKEANNSTDQALPCTSLTSYGVVPTKIEKILPQKSTYSRQSAKLQASKTSTQFPCGSLNHPAHFPPLPTVPSIPCPQDPACGYIMGALEPSFPPSTRLLLNIAGTCQHWAREWLRTEKEVMELQVDRIRQRYTLALLYCEFKGHTWVNATLWLSDLHECDWIDMIGIDPCSRNGEYQILRNYFGQQISGTLPPELSMLSSLWEIVLHDSLLSGTIPSDYAKLTQLDTLVLSFNFLEGTIPDFIWQYNDMNYLDLAGNSFAGTLPASLHLTEPNLKTLFLEDNNLTGTIPSGFGSLDWKRLDLAGNDLTGSIPIDLNAPSFEVLRLHNNKLIGAFPADSFANDYIGVSKLKEITLYHNNLTGSVNEICNLFYDGMLEIFEVDLWRIDCLCCGGAPYR